MFGRRPGAPCYDTANTSVPWKESLQDTTRLYPSPGDCQGEHDWSLRRGLETSNDRYWSASREPQRSMTSRGYDPRQSPGLGYKRVVSCKDSFHGTDVLAVSEHGAPGRRPN